MTARRLTLTLVLAACALGAAHAQNPRDTVIINPFDVAAGRDADCLAAWDKAAMILREKPGFKSARLFRTTGAGGKSSFVTVGVWNTPEAYEAATADKQFRAAFSTEVCSGNPAPYRAVRELVGSAGVPTGAVLPHLDASNIR